MGKLLQGVAAVLLAFTWTGAAPAANRAMSDAELRALLRVVKVVKLGGPSSGYHGAMVLTGSVTGGSARILVLINGQWKLVKGTWKISAGKFCRIWDTIDPGKEICETWRYLTETSVEVFDGTRSIGVNSW